MKGGNGGVCEGVEWDDKCGRNKSSNGVGINN